MTPSKKAAPYGKPIPPGALAAIVAKAKPDFSDKLLAHLAAQTAAIRRLTSAQGELSLDALQKTYRAGITGAVSDVLAGGDPAAVTKAKNLETLGREFSARRTALTQAHGKIAADSVDWIMMAGEAIMAAVEKLAGDIEASERADAAEFAVPFAPSERLRLVNAVAAVIANRFSGLREAAKTDPQHIGSPRTVLGDLIDCSDW